MRWVYLHDNIYRCITFYFTNIWQAGYCFVTRKWTYLNRLCDMSSQSTNFTVGNDLSLCVQRLKRLTNTFQFVFWKNLESDSVICEPGTRWTLVYGFVYLVKVSRVMALFSLTTDTVEYMAVLCGLLNVCHQRDYLWNIIPLSHPFSVWHTLHHRQRL